MGCEVAGGVDWGAGECWSGGVGVLADFGRALAGHR